MNKAHACLPAVAPRNRQSASTGRLSNKLRHALSTLLFLLVASLLSSGPSLGASSSRTSAFEYDVDGVLIKEVIEPGNSELCVATQYSLDVYGNRSITQTRNCNGSAIPGAGNEAAAPPPTPATPSLNSSFATFEPRTTNIQYTATAENPTPGQFPTQNTNALNHKQTQAFDPRFGTAIRLTDPNGLITTSQYDHFGRKTLQTHPDGTRTHTQYILCAQQAGICPTSINNTIPYAYIATWDSTATNTQNSPVTRTYYDSLDRPLRTQTQTPTSPTDWAWNTQDSIYNALGQVGKKSTPYLIASNGTTLQTPQWSTYTHDILGRLVREQTTDPLATNTANQQNGQYTRTLSYNAQSTTTTNTKGQSTTVTLNVAGQTATVTDAQGQTITHIYDPQGNLTQTKAAGVTVTLTYDLRGRKTAMNDPHMGQWHYRYNALGELRAQQNAKGQLTLIAYDKLGRQTEKRQADLISTWLYDTHESACANAPATAKGKLTRAATSTGYERIHCHDAMSRPVSERVRMDNQTFWSGTSYQASTGRVDKIVYPARVQPNSAPLGNTAPSAGFVVQNEYNTLGLTSQKNATTGAVLWRQLKLEANGTPGTGRIERTLLGNGLVNDKYLDPLGRTWYDTTGPAGPNNGPASSYKLFAQYRFDSENNLTSRQWFDYQPGSSNGGPSAPGTAPIAYLESFGYDSLNRLVSSAGTVTSNANPNLANTLPSKTVSYSAHGNILTKDARTYQYNDAARPHRLTGLLGEIHASANPSYTYDANGNLTQGAGSTISWMSFDMVDTITQGSQSSVFRYGPEHQRVKQVANYNGQAITTWYLQGMELEVNSSTNVSSAKYYVAGRVLQIDKGTGTTPTTSETQYLHTDHIGSVIGVSNQAGVLIEQYSFDAWGKRRKLDGSDYLANGGHLLGATDRGFTGHEQLDHLGLVHMNGRIYDASLGRFMSADPFIAQAANLQNHNRYAYVNNNPLSYTDPSGFFLKKLFKNKVFRLAVAIGVAYMTGYYDFSSVATVKSIGAFGASATGWAGGAAAFGNAVISGAALGGISSGSWKGALTGGVSGALFWGAGSVGQAHGLAENGAGMVGLHAAAGCVSSALGGGECAQGAASAGFSKYAGNALGDWGDANLIRQMVIGGTASVIAGGSFENGAKTSAFLYMFSEAAKYYEDNVGRKANPLPGYNRIQQPYEYDQKTGRQFQDSEEENVIGIRKALIGTWYRLENFFTEGGILSRALNVIPSMNAIGGLHDYWFNAPAYNLKFNLINNIGTMLPAATISIGAIMGNFSEVWKNNPALFQSLTTKN